MPRKTTTTGEDGQQRRRWDTIVTGLFWVFIVVSAAVAGGLLISKLGGSPEFTTTILFVNAGTGKAVLTRPTRVAIQGADAGYYGPVSYPTPGKATLTWTGGGRVFFEVPGYSEKDSDSTVSLDEAKPVVTLKLRPLARSAR